MGKIQIKHSQGQTLLEALIALGVIVVILSAVSVSVLTSVSNSIFIKSQNQANKLAQQGIEYFRDQISNNGQFATYAGYTSGTTKCLSTNNILGAGACPSANIGLFKREATFIAGSSCSSDVALTNGIEIAVDVYWTSGKCTAPFCNKQEVRSCFINPKIISPTGGQGI